MAEQLGVGKLGSFGQSTGLATIIPPGSTLNAFLLGEIPPVVSGELPAWLNCIDDNESGLYTTISAYLEGDYFNGTLNAYSLGHEQGEASGTLNAYSYGVGVFIDGTLSAYALNQGVDGSIMAYANASGLPGYFGGFTEFDSSLNAYIGRDTAGMLNAYALGPGVPDSGILDAILTGCELCSGILNAVVPNVYEVFSGIINAYTSGF